MKLKRKFALALVIFVVAAFAQTVEAQTPRVRIDGEFVDIPENDQSPVVIYGRTLVPLRAVMEALGFHVQWRAADSVATLTKPGYVVRVQIGNIDLFVNDEIIPLDVPAQLIGGRTMVPLRAVSEVVGMGVRWDGENAIADIFSEAPQPVPETIRLRPHYQLPTWFHDTPRQFRHVFYSVPSEIVALTDATRAGEWLREITESGEALEYMALMRFVQYFEIPRAAFDAAIATRRSIYLERGFDLADELHELPNADIIFTFDDELIREFYRR